MYDFRLEIVTLAEKALQAFVRFRLHDMGLEDIWSNGLKSFVEKEYIKHEANYKKLYLFFQSHEENDLVLEQLDITSLTTLIEYYWNSMGIYKVSPDSVQLFKNHVLGIRTLRNTFEHYTKELIESDASRMYYDQLYFTECISSFAVLVMKYKSPTDEWKNFYHKARKIISTLQGERWIALDDTEKVLEADEDISTILALAEQGNVPAQVQAGKVYYYGIREQLDQEKAYMWFYKAAKRGSAEAEYYIGECYKHSCGVEFNDDVAMSWYKKAAEHGFAAAQYEWGFRNYLKENITEDEMLEMVRFIKLSADQNYPRALWTLGGYYTTGYGVKEDVVLGKQLREKSALLGYKLASKLLAQSAEKEGNFEEALNWYMLANKQGDRYSVYSIRRLKEKIEEQQHNAE